MSSEIVLAFKPSSKMSDWSLRSDSAHNWFYEQRVQFYDTGCKSYQAYCHFHKRKVGEERYHDLIKGKNVKAPRIHIDHYPEKGEWERFESIEDVKSSPSLLKVTVEEL